MKLLLVVLLVGSVQLAFAQLKTITGKVTGPDGPVPGASVLEKGTNNGTITNSDGTYSITVSDDDAVLIFSSIGLKSVEKAVSGKTTINVKMSSDKEQLEEVVVTALGISREKKSLGYAVSEVGGDEVKQSGSNNVIQALAAKAPGVQVTGSGGTPGASSKILLRGNATFTGENQPLIVVDGVPIDNSTTQTTAGDYPFNQNLSGVNNANRAIDLNPDDIESVTVLKGPAAAALYGARAGNGAIIYTTKRGKAGQGKSLGVTVSQELSFNQVNKLPELQSTYAQGVGGGTPAGDANATFVEGDPGPDNTYFTADDGSIGTSASWGPSIASLGIDTYDNPGNFFKTGVSSNTNITVNGGTDRTGFRLNVGYLTDNGMVPNTNYNRFSVRLTADTRLNDKIKVGGTVNYINSNQTAAQNGSNLAGIMLGLMRAPASYDLRDYQYDNGNQRTYFAFYDNPYFTAFENPFTSDINRVLGNVYANYQATDWLTFDYKVGIDAYSDFREQRFAISSFGDDIGGVGQVNLNNLSNVDFYQDFIARGTFNLTEDLGLNALLGHNITTSSFVDRFQRGRILAVRDFYNLNNASDRYASNSLTEIATTAFFGQLEFSYKDFLFVTATGRRETSSTFELEDNTFFYPSVSASMVFTELWDDRPEWFNFGKIRYSYAQTGISPIAYATRPIYTSPIFTDGFTNGLSFPYLGQNGFGISDIFYSPDLKPERNNANEYGLNLVFMDRKIDLDFTYYSQRTTDALLFQPLAPSTGFSSAYVNGGELANRGVEISLGLVPVRNEDFQYTVRFNYTRNRSEVLSLVPGVDEFNVEAAFASIGSFAIVGQPYGAFYGTVWERNDAGELLIGANGLPTPAAATEGVGDPNPDWIGGIRNTFQYKNLSFSFFWDIRMGGDIWNGTFARLNNLGRTAESAENREGTYLIEGVYAPGTTINGVDVSGQANTTEVNAINYFRQYVGDAGGAAEQFVEDGSWARLRDVNLSYRIRFEDRKYGIDYLDLSFNGRNLLLFTDYKGVDPETSLTGAGSNIGGLDYFNNPGSRTYTFGVKFGF